MFHGPRSTLPWTGLDYFLHICSRCGRCGQLGACGVAWGVGLCVGRKNSSPFAILPTTYVQINVGIPSSPSPLPSRSSTFCAHFAAYLYLFVKPLSPCYRYMCPVVAWILFDAYPRSLVHFSQLLRTHPWHRSVVIGLWYICRPPPVPSSRGERLAARTR